MTVPEPLLAESAYPAVLDPLIGPEFEIDLPTRFGVAGAGGLNSRCAAYGAGVFFVPGFNDQWQISDYVFGVRVRATDGLILDPGGLLIETRHRGGSFPCAAYDGAGNFLVVYDFLGAGFFVAKRVRASDGAVLDSVATVISSTVPTSSGGLPALLLEDGVFLLAYSQETSPPNQSSLFGQRLTPAGYLRRCEL
jgi:hypothetical protein